MILGGQTDLSVSSRMHYGLLLMLVRRWFCFGRP
jgi:hypothetical protein